MTVTIFPSDHLGIGLPQGPKPSGGRIVGDDPNQVGDRLPRLVQHQPTPAEEVAEQVSLIKRRDRADPFVADVATGRPLATRKSAMLADAS